MTRPSVVIARLCMGRWAWRSRHWLASSALTALALGSGLSPASLHASSGPGAPVAVHTFACIGTPAFGGPCPQGGRPDTLLLGASGTLYGTAQVSLEGSSNPQGGTVFALSPGGQFTLLHTFAPGPSKTYPGGDHPNTLLQGTDGNLYGATIDGGVHEAGVLYRLSPTGAGFQILHQFCSAAQCADGNLYGTTAYGGASGTTCGGFAGCGTIFRVTPATGGYNVLFRFNGTTDGGAPAGLVQAADGSLYGLAGTHLFHFVPATGAFTAVALPFPSTPLPQVPLGGLTLGPNGLLYGLYSIYGKGGVGLFEVATDGSQFQQFAEYNTTQDAGIADSLLLASDGTFWIAEFNGTTGYGDIVRVSPADGTLLQTVTTFSPTDASGAYPTTLLQASDGTFWSTTDQFGRASSGHFADGVVFSLNAGLAQQGR